MCEQNHGLTPLQKNADFPSSKYQLMCSLEKYFFGSRTSLNSLFEQF